MENAFKLVDDMNSRLVAQVYITNNTTIWRYARTRYQIKKSLINLSACRRTEDVGNDTTL
jgi:hypothetical protein